MHNRGFTLVELLATIAIVALIAVLALEFIPAYMNWAQNVSDQHTLLVLNDALTRYKTEGGGLTAFTSGAPMADVVGALQQPINWNGMVHQVMQKALIVNAHSLYATGSGSAYQFSGYNTYTATPGGTSPRAIIPFTGVGTTTWTVPAGVSKVQVLVVGGGGGGGSGSSNCVGGGGAGGYLYNTSYSVTPGQSITVTVGAGGNGGQPATAGGNSVFGTMTAIGGGRAVNGYGDTPPVGGSGGGGGYVSVGTGTAGQGYSGGLGSSTGAAQGGGGGGAGGAGSAAVVFQAGNGGPGLSCSISGSPTYYAGGGGGAAGGEFDSIANIGTGGVGGGGNGGFGTSVAGINGAPNTGGGGGGGGPNGGTAGSGGSGVVIISY